MQSRSSSRLESHPVKLPREPRTQAPAVVLRPQQDPQNQNVCLTRTPGQPLHNPEGAREPPGMSGLQGPGLGAAFPLLDPPSTEDVHWGEGRRTEGFCVLHSANEKQRPACRPEENQGGAHQSVSWSCRRLHHAPAAACPDKHNCRNSQRAKPRVAGTRGAKDTGASWQALGRAWNRSTSPGLRRGSRTAPQPPA